MQNLFMKEVLSYSFLFPQNFKDVKNINFNNPVLWILNNHLIPPHVGFSFEKKYYSLKAYGKDENVLVDNFLKRFNHKKIPIVFMEVDFNLKMDHLINVFNRYEYAGDLSSTCITPILQLFNLTKPTIILPELLNVLHNNNYVKISAIINQKSNIVGIKKYSREEILLINKKMKNARRK